MSRGEGHTMKAMVKITDYRVHLRHDCQNFKLFKHPCNSMKSTGPPFHFIEEETKPSREQTNRLKSHSEDTEEWGLKLGSSYWSGLLPHHCVDRGVLITYTTGVRAISIPTGTG